MKTKLSPYICGFALLLITFFLSGKKLFTYLKHCQPLSTSTAKLYYYVPTVWRYCFMFSKQTSRPHMDQGEFIMLTAPGYFSEFTWVMHTGQLPSKTVSTFIHEQMHHHEHRWGKRNLHNLLWSSAWSQASPFPPSSVPVGQPNSSPPNCSPTWL